MARVGWLTDLHLNFVSHARRIDFYDQIRGEDLDVILVGGDTGEADSVSGLLSELAEHIEAPTYFVLGNHDFYG
ncbi:MAG: phosphoesterase, partial [bacterium]|nr:phosphoesterase [bacterium]